MSEDGIMPDVDASSAVAGCGLCIEGSGHEEVGAVTDWGRASADDCSVMNAFGAHVAGDTILGS